MFNKYSYKTVPLAGIQRNQTYKKLKLKKKQFFLQLLQMFILFMVAHVYICLENFYWNSIILIKNDDWIILFSVLWLFLGYGD